MMTSVISLGLGMVRLWTALASFADVVHSAIACKATKNRSGSKYSTEHQRDENRRSTEKILLQAATSWQAQTSCSARMLTAPKAMRFAAES
jgi:hypothetical protein